jgi:hypothetical protein
MPPVIAARQAPSATTVNAAAAAVASDAPILRASANRVAP